MDSSEKNENFQDMHMVIVVIFTFHRISLFIATNICETIVWKAFSPATVNTGRGKLLLSFHSSDELTYAK